MEGPIGVGLITPSSGGLVPYQLGIDLGTTYSAAAVAEGGDVEIFQLGASIAAVPSVVLLREDGTVLTGEAALRRSLFESSRTAREFKRRLGDPTPYLLGGTPYGVEALTAHLLASIVERVVTQRGEEPETTVLAHPAGYGPYKLGFLTEAGRLAGVGAVRFVPEPVAAAIYYAQTERVAQGEMIGVYDFGGGTLDLATVRKSGETFEVVGTPEGMERFGGIDLDEAVFGYVDDVLGGIVSDSNRDDEATVAAMVALRNACCEAKEALSADTDAAIPVMLPNLHTEVRLTRGEFEDMIRPRLRETLTALERTVESAGMTFDDLSRILLVGGASRIPLVADMVRESTGRPVAVDAHPKHAVALGAALVPAGADTSPTPVTPSETPAEGVESSTAQSAAAVTGSGTVKAVSPGSTSMSAPETDQPVVSPVEREPDDAPTPSMSEDGGEELVGDGPPKHPDGDGAAGRPRWLYAALGVFVVLILAIAGLLLLRSGGEQPEDAAPAATFFPDSTGDIAARVAAVYHIDYRSMDRDGEWGGWSADGNEAPDDIASDYLPALGPYSSTDPGVRNEHFEMFNRASIGIVSIVWDGRDSPSGLLITDVLNDAERRGLSAAFIFELPDGAGPEVLPSEIQYLFDTYGDHPALFRPGQPSRWTENAGMMVVVVGTEVWEERGDVDVGAWRDAIDVVHQIGDGVIVLAVSSDSVWVDEGHFDGLADGPIDGVEPPSYGWVEHLPEGAWFVPVVSPGNSASWSSEAEPAVSRGDGSRYEEQWDAAMSAPVPPNLVMVLSFNEWQSGTQIEPAAPESTRGDGTPYLDYEPVSPEGYLDLTRAAVERWAAP